MNFSASLNIKSGCLVNLFGRAGTASIVTARAFIRGGNWNNGANAGAFTLNLNNSPSNVNSNIGFRCARFSDLFGRNFRYRLAKRKASR